MEFKHNSRNFLTAIGITSEEETLLSMKFIDLYKKSSKKSQIVEGLTRIILEETNILDSLDEKDKFIKMFSLGWLMSERWESMDSLTDSKSDSEDAEHTSAFKEFLSMLGETVESEDTEDVEDLFSIDATELTDQIIESLTKAKDGSVGLGEMMAAVKKIHDTDSAIDYNKIPDDLIKFFIEDMVKCDANECPAIPTATCPIYNKYLEIKNNFHG